MKENAIQKICEKQIRKNKEKNKQRQDSTSKEKFYNKGKK